MLRTAMSRMVREIGAAFVSDRYDAKRYRDAFDRPTNFIGDQRQAAVHLARAPAAVRRRQGVRPDGGGVLR